MRSTPSLLRAVFFVTLAPVCASCSVLLDANGRQCNSDADCRALDPTMPLVCQEHVCVLRDASSSDSLPVVVDEHFSPTGARGDAEMSAVTETVACPRRAGLQRGDCHAFLYDPRGAQSPLNWASLSWQSPDNNWGSEFGYAMPAGARAVSFYAWSDRPDTTVTFGAGFADGDGFEARIGPVVAGLEPRQFFVDLESADYTDVANGFMWEMPAHPEGPVTLYVDDIAWVSEAPPVRVTFQVDMTAQELASDCSVYVYGTFNEWAVRANPMSDADGDHVYTATVTLTPDTAVQYKYAYVCGPTETPENLPTGAACTALDGSVTNRTVTPTEAAALPPVCFGTCGACSSVVDVTLQLDTRSHPVGAGCTVHAPGSYNGWNTSAGAAQMSNGGSGTLYSLTVPLMTGVPYEYKFNIQCPAAALDWETLNSSSCTVMSGGYWNRGHTPSQAAALPAVCWGTCTACP